MLTLRKKMYIILERIPSTSKLAKRVNLLLQALILLNVIAVLLGSIPNLRKELVEELHIFEIISVGIFAIEYILRIWCSVELAPNSNPFIVRIKYMFRFLSLIDFIAILPFFIFFANSDLRMLRIVRLLKILRYSKGIKLFTRVFKQKREELISTFFIFIVFLVLISSCAYWLEKDAQPEVFTSIPAAMWWGVATLTTVGYGDMVPITYLGRLLGAISAVIGIAMYALPSGIIVSGFMQEWKQDKLEKDKKKH